MSFIKLLEQQNLLPLLTQVQTGIERETLRVGKNNHLSQQPHPQCLGSSLTHRYITTDFSEALVELITPVFKDTHRLLSFLTELQHFVSKGLASDEYLWPGSMPAILDEHIPIAYYGRSNLAKLKQVYRRGLHHRYGSPMQTIAGLHYNFSLSDDFWPAYLDSPLAAQYKHCSASDAYFHLIRNFRRHAWLLIYWFGASPVFDQSFTHNHLFFGSTAYDAYRPYLKPLGKRSLYCPQATSLRMSALGYRNLNQSAIRLCFNSLNEYIASLYQALAMPCPEYEKIGCADQYGYKQLNTHLLQIENELYGTIRPKQITQDHERPVQALERRGIAYLEVRLLDNSPFHPLGIDNKAMHLVQLFLLSCLFDASPAIDEQECDAIEAFQDKMILAGRSPDLDLLNRAMPFMALMEELAEALDKNNSNHLFSPLCHTYKQQLVHPECTLSAQLIAELQDNHCDYVDLIADYAYKHKNFLLQKSVDPQQQTVFSRETEKSLQLQLESETSDQRDFETFLQDYLKL